MRTKLDRYNFEGRTLKEVDGKLLASPLSDQPDFSIFTAPMLVDPTRDLLVNMTGSSTEQDLQGDIMDIQALKSMTLVDTGLAIWMNHDYELPESLFGSLAAAPIIKSQNGVADLDITVEVEPGNPRAMQTYSYIKRGKTRLGCSIGCKVLKYEVIDDNLDPNDPMSIYFAPMRILAVKTLEWSVVGIPANQRSWVENAARGIFQRTLDPRLAPAVKSLFPRDYERIVASVEDRAQREELAAIPARPTPTRRLAWQPETKTFLLVSNKSEEPVLAADIPAVIEELSAETTMTKSADKTKGASGSSDWPLTDRDVAWDNGEATSAIENWAKGDDGKLDAAKLASVHFWKDSSADGSLIGSYKLLYCDVISGDVKAVPKGIFACAAAMQGSHGNTPDIDDADGVRAKIAGWYKKMAKEFKDPTIVPPWEKEDAGSEAVETTADATIETTAAAELADVIAPDGAELTDVTESAENVELTASAESVEPTASAEPVEPATDPMRLWMLETYNSLGKQLGFAEVGLTRADAGADASAAGDAAKPAPDAPPTKQIDTGQVGSLALQIDDLSDTLAVQTDQLLRAMNLHDNDDDDTQAAENRAAGKKNVGAAMHLLRMFRIVTTKAGARHSAEDLASIQDIHDACMALTDGAVCMKSAEAEQSSDDPDDNDDAVDGTMAAVVPFTDELKLLREALGGIKTQALEADVAKTAAQLDEVRKSLEVRKAELDQLVADAQRAKQDALKAAAYAREANDNIKQLSEMPLGRPTGQIGRRVKVTDAAVDFSEMMKLAGAQTPSERSAKSDLESALEETTVEYVKGVGKVRHWPDGVGVGVRPRLTNDQKIIMSANDITSYLEGGEATVPETE